MPKKYLVGLFFSLVVSAFIVGCLVGYALLNKKPQFCDDLTSNKLIQNPPPKNFIWHGNGLITLWFDDALRSQYDVAIPLMEKQNFIGVISVTTNYICLPWFMTWRELKQLQATGWEMASHTMMHSCDVNSYTDTIAKTELAESKKVLALRGIRADSFVMPCGATTPSLVAIIKKYYQSHRISGGGINSIPVKDAYSLKSFIVTRETSLTQINNILRQTEEQHGWLILVFHGVGENSEDYLTITPKMFAAILQMIKNSTLSIVVPNQVLKIRRDAAVS